MNRGVRGTRRGRGHPGPGAGIVRPCAVAYLPITGGPGDGLRIGRGSGGRPPRSSIAGGFVLVPVAALMAAWRACRSRPLGIGDFRAWLASREMVARRCTLDEGRRRRLHARRAGRAPGRRPQAGRGPRSGAWRPPGSSSGPSSAIALPRPGRPGGRRRASADTIGRGRGSLAIPRRILRLLAGGARPALIATALGVLLRCLSRRRGRLRRPGPGQGRLDRPRLRRRPPPASSRPAASCVDLGWIAPEPSDQWATEPLGAAPTGSTWPGRRRPARRRRDCHPSRPPGGPRSPPPDLDQEPLRERKNQEPGPGRTGWGSALRDRASRAGRPRRPDRSRRPGWTTSGSRT